MQKLNNRIGLKQLLFITLILAFVAALSQSFKGTGNEINFGKSSVTINTAVNKISGNDKADSDKKKEQESANAFIEAYRVFMHPRCMNCHPTGDSPLQGDDSRIHAQNVTRGPDGRGLYAMKCSNCHQSQHIQGEHMPPGLPTWHLPPAHRKMVFQGKTAAQLATHFKDKNFTGFKDFKKDLLHHVENDPLVKNSWTYGTPPPLSHEEFVGKVREWIEKGAATPK